MTETNGAGGAVAIGGPVLMVRCCGMNCLAHNGGFMVSWGEAQQARIWDMSCWECHSAHTGWGSAFWDSGIACFQLLRCNFSGGTNTVCSCVAQTSNNVGDIPSYAQFQTMLNNSADMASWYLRNRAGSWLELCVFVDEKSSTRGLIHVHYGDAHVLRCLFKGTSAWILSAEGAKNTFRIWDCLFFDVIPTTISNAAASEMIENYARYVATLTLRTKETTRGCIVVYQVTDGPETPTLGAGTLGNIICPNDAVNGYYEKGKDRISHPSKSNACLKIDRCTFDRISSGNANGGAVSFTGTDTSSAELVDSQFSSCVTTTSQTSFYGGAVYLSVKRIKTANICGSKCISFVGTFLAISTTNEWFECSGCSIWNCGTEGYFSKTGGGAIDIQGLLFEMRDSNFSGCRQNDQAATLQQRMQPSTNLSVRLYYVTCLECHGASGISLKWPYYMDFYLCIFMKNSVSTGGGWFESNANGLCLGLKFCYFVAVTGNLFISKSGTFYVDVMYCYFDTTLTTAFNNGVVTFLHNIEGYVNTVTISGSPSGLCYPLFWVPSLAFSESVHLITTSGFHETDSFSETNQFSETDHLSETSKCSETDELDRTVDITETDGLDKTIDLSETDKLPETGRASATDTISESNGIEESAKLSHSEDMRISDGHESTETHSRSDDFSSSPLFTKTNGFSGTEAIPLSIVLRRTSHFSDSLDCSSSDKISVSSVAVPTFAFHSSDGNGMGFFRNTDVLERTEDFSGTRILTATIGFTAFTTNSFEAVDFIETVTQYVPTSVLATSSSLQSVQPVPAPILSSVPPPSSVLPDSTVPPETAPPPASTIRLAATEIWQSTHIPASVPPPVSSDFPASTRLPIETNSPVSTMPPASTAPPAQTIAADGSPYATVFPESTVKPETLRLPDATHSIEATPSPRSTDPVPPSAPVQSTVPPNPTIAPPSTIPPETARPPPATVRPPATVAPPSTLPIQSSVSRQVTIPSRSDMSDKVSLSTQVGDKQSDDGKSEMPPLVVSIVLMVVFCILFGVLMYTEEKKRKARLDARKQAKNKTGKGMVKH
jgi:hypothetical protein